VAKTSKQTAFVLDPNVAAAADGAHIPGIPGIWRHDQPVSAEALGMGVGELRGVIDRLGLPLVEVQVAEGSAATSFERASGDTLLPSSPTSSHLGLVPQPVLDEEAQAELEQANARRVVEQMDERAGEVEG
jgi:hypothetical protein